MSFLAGIVGLIGLLCLLVVVVGLISPSFFKDKKTGEVPKRSHIAVGGVAGSFIAFAIAGALAPDTAPAEQVAEKASAAAPAKTAKSEHPADAPPAIEPEAKPVKNLGMTPEEFRKAFNGIVVQIDAGYKLAKFDIEKGDVNNTFNRSLGRNVGLMGSVGKQDGKLKELMLIVAGGGEKTEDMLRPVVMILTASQALNPQVDKGENSKIVMDMAKQALANIDTGKPIERTVGQLQYTASASQLTGLMFAISPM